MAMRIRPIPLISAIAASNEIPDDKAVQAAYDRFLVRLSVGYVRDPEDFRATLTSNAGGTNHARVDHDR